MSEEAVRTYASAKRFHDGTRDRWLRCTPGDQSALLGVAERLRLGENQVRDLLDTFEAIAVRRGCSFTEILDDESIRCVLAEGRGRNETLSGLKRALRRLKFPQLSATEVRLQGLIKGVRLPSGVAMILPENLEGEELVVSIRGRSAEELRRRIDEAARLFQGAAIDEMFRVLGGEW